MNLFIRFLFYINIIIWRCPTISKELSINDQIRDKELRIISETGEQLGIMSSREAQAIANSKNLDLVKISPNAKPPVCKIMDYGKYRFEQAKREKEAKKNQRVMDLKEIRLSLNIDTHDFNTKLKHASRFIGDGNKVKVVLRFKGRQLSHVEVGENIMNKFIELVDEYAVIEKKPVLDGKLLTAVLASKVKK